MNTLWIPLLFRKMEFSWEYMYSIFLYFPENLDEAYCKHCFSEMAGFSEHPKSLFAT